ncbi:Tda4p [Kluyveromyces lactis]|uniref:KLLA0D10868p n=1 Tax=Kluyveromyces lactis (strain ATCC 8585 / CBS 2359 / DSM 70799 / NBRC 1267 / NRRL Y-1140 / WM37) TaxID=284590 RepID=Q6CR93_KLULA|nr:uncharacterized protein KLLA0_D10868g [Kluyveromyces lactis]CAH00642.1 KLLA0D10868p [Kluyveromyces lactis]|eukprot:XP_453546.1 uncharacterized protein KLLA0_D10868g [Kluyveromyces lactis]
MLEKLSSYFTGPELSDPLLSWSFDPSSENLYYRHLHEALISFVVYQFILYPFVVPKLNEWFFKEHYTERDEPDKINFDIHTVSMIQSVVSLYLIWPLLWIPFGFNVATYYNSYASMVSAVSIGYFMWDLYICLRYFKLFGIGFLFHAVAAFAVLTITLHPVCQAWIGRFLSFEASTPFVNINWYIIQLSRGSSKQVVPTWFNVLNGFLLISVFFFVRLVWGFVAVAILIYEMWQVWDQIPLYMTAVILGINVSLDFLNIHWFSKMLKIAKKMANGSKRVSKID